MNIQTTYQCVAERYPEQLEEIQAQLKKSKSKEKGVPLAEWDWSFHFCVRIEDCGLNIMDILAGKKPKPVPKAQQLYEQRLKNTSCGIMVSRRHACMQSLPLKELPKEIVDFWQKEKEERLKEETRINTLTPKENQAEISGLLAKLGKSPGFVGIHISH